MRNLILWAAAMLCTASLQCPAFAQETSVSDTAVVEEPTLDVFAGKWMSDGDAFGQKAESHLTWSPALGGKFYHVTYSIKAVKGSDRHPMFDGVAYYRPGTPGGYEAFWADSSGDLHPIKATLKDGALTALWGVAGQKLGRTEYRLGDEGSLTVTDWIMRDHEWQKFNQNIFKRQD